jgi:alkylation response protein AidB-like acyl-CoA dehydrogenase
MSTSRTVDNTNQLQSPQTDWAAVARRLGPSFAARATQHDADDAFVADNYRELKQHKLFSAGVPAELGGGGASHAELCALLRELAHYCESTALALSMHTHLMAAVVWRWRQGQPVEPLLRRIANEETVLISTGASDWLDSSGTAEKVDNGYRVTARKIFCSGCPMGDLLITSAVYHDPKDGPMVLHFPVPFTAEGVKVMDDWLTMGMRATGSHDVVLEGVLVPESAVSLRRPQGEWHPLFNVVVTVAMPLIMSVYVGVAEAARDLACREALKKRHDPHVPYLVGEMENTLVTAQMALREMVELTANYDFGPTEQTTNATLIRKTIAARATMQAVEKALEVVGGAGFFRGLGLERMLRDVHGAQFHPLPEKRQLLFTGRLALGLEPAG